MDPLVTVLLPVYNGAKYLNEAIDSILNQTYSNFELLIIDDGSTDESLNLISAYTDRRIRLVKNERNMGLTATFNKGIDLATGKYVSRMDADDVSDITRIGKQVKYLEEHPHVAMVDCIMEYIDTDGKSLNKYNSDVISEKDIRTSLPNNNYLGHSSITIRTELYKKYKYRHTDVEDYDLWLRLANDGHIIHKLPEPLLKYRIHVNSYTIQRRKRNRNMLRLAVTKRSYLGCIPVGDLFKTFNLRVLYYMIKQYIVGYIKYALDYKAASR